MKKMNAFLSIQRLHKGVSRILFLGAFLFLGISMTAQVSNDQAVVILTQEAESLNATIKPVVIGQASATEDYFVARVKQDFYQKVTASIQDGASVQLAINDNLPAGLPTVETLGGFKVIRNDKQAAEVLKTQTESLLGL